MSNFWKNKKVAVTGASGFIGSHAVLTLIQKGSKVTAIVSPKTEDSYLKLIFGENFKKIVIKKANLQILEGCINATQGQDIVLNFAALDGGAAFKAQHPAEIFRVNTEITLNMLEASVRNKVDRFLLMSSIEVYPKGLKEPIKEDYELKENFQEDINGYAWSKRLGEIAAKMYSRQYGLKVAIARAGNVYGPGDSFEKGRVIPSFLKSAIDGDEIQLTGKNIKRSFLYIQDLIVALLDLAEKYAICDAVNILSGEYIALEDLAKEIVSIIGSSSRIIRKELLIEGPAARIVSTDKARRIINFKERISLAEGIKEVLNNYDKAN